MDNITIITGSTLGGAEYVADHLSDLLNEKGISTHILNEAILEETPLTGYWLIITSTHGAGDYPDNIQPFITQLESQQPDLSSLQYAVIAIGDSSYDTYCAAGIHADQLIERLGATRINTRLDIDVTQDPVPEDPAEAWLSTWPLAKCE